MKKKTRLEDPTFRLGWSFSRREKSSLFVPHFFFGIKLPKKTNSFASQSIISVSSSTNTKDLKQIFEMSKRQKKATNLSTFHMAKGGPTNLATELTELAEPIQKKAKTTALGASLGIEKKKKTVKDKATKKRKEKAGDPEGRSPPNRYRGGLQLLHGEAHKVLSPTYHSGIPVAHRHRERLESHEEDLWKMIQKNHEFLQHIEKLEASVRMKDKLSSTANARIRELEVTENRLTQEPKEKKKQLRAAVAE
ncbi:hypothetical protein U1Q18_016608 [Sarracenia purpurea var. burkii]